MMISNSKLLSVASLEILGEPNAATVVPEQPDVSTVEMISAIHEYRENDRNVSLYGNKQSVLVVDDVPFAVYWQLTKKKFVFHPMVWGRYVHSNAQNTDFVKRLPELSERMGTSLPNGVLAFFYPNHYPLSRMCGPELMYSAISQSEALAGYLHAEALFPDAGLESLTDRVRNALFFEHQRGGVDLGVAQLELPLMHANPEIILNGWLHSLFNLTDYANRRGDVEVAAYVERNIRFLLDNNSCWYDENRYISRYSETCPQRLVIRTSKHGNSDNIGQSFVTVYKSRTSDLPNYAFEPIIDYKKNMAALTTGSLNVTRKPMH